MGLRPLLVRLHHVIVKPAMASSNSVLVFLLSLSCVMFLPCKGQGKRVTCPISRLGYLCVLYNAERWSHRYLEVSCRRSTHVAMVDGESSFWSAIIIPMAFVLVPRTRLRLTTRSRRISNS